MDSAPEKGAEPNSHPSGSLCAAKVHNNNNGTRLVRDESRTYMKTITKLLPALAYCAILAGCNQSETTTQDSTKGAAPAAMATGTVKRQDLVGYSFFDGKLVVPSTAQANAFSPYDTPIVSVSTAVGKYVERGEPIVKLAIPGADEATTMARASAQAANSTLSDDKNAASGPVKDAQKALADARAAEKTAKDTVAAGGTADVDSATQARVEAEAALQSAQQTLAQTVQPAKDVANISNAQLQATKADAAKGLVRAPISGTIVTFDAKPGMDAKSAQSLATIVDFGAARVQGVVPAELKDLVVRNSRVIIAMAGPSSDPLLGKVREVSVIPPTSGQQSPGYLAVIEFVNPRAMTQPSLTIQRIGVKTGSVKQALVVPVNAVTKQNGKSFVKVKNGNDWTSTAVETGLSDGALIEIKSGLTEGAVIQLN